jgi:hypothetical protein
VHVELFSQGPSDSSHIVVLLMNSFGGQGAVSPVHVAFN